MQKDSQGKQGLTIHLVIELQASNFRSPNCNLHGELGGHRLGLELSLRFNNTLLLKECHLPLGVY
jgi:hypothetical protein